MYSHLFTKTERSDSVADDLVGHADSRLTDVTLENVATVSAIVWQQTWKSDRKIVAKTTLKRSSTHTILRSSLHMFPYKIQSHQAIPVSAVRQQLDFLNRILNMIYNDGFGVDCIWFTDEAHFHLNRFVNKQNYRFWCSINSFYVWRYHLFIRNLQFGCGIQQRHYCLFHYSLNNNQGTLCCNFTTFFATYRVFVNPPDNQWFMQDGAL